MAASLVLLACFAPLRADVVALYALGVAVAAAYTDFFKPRGIPEVALSLGHGLSATSFAYAVAAPLTMTGVAAGILLGMLAGMIVSIDHLQDVTDFRRRAQSLAEMIFKTRVRLSSLWWFAVTSTLVMQAGFVLMGWLPRETMLSIFVLPPAHVAGILLDYSFERGVHLGLMTMWLFAALMAVGAAV